MVTALESTLSELVEAVPVCFRMSLWGLLPARVTVGVEYGV